MKRFMPFTGRQKTVARLENLLEDALEYKGSVVLIRGNIGVGKSRLLDHFLRSVRHRGFHILRGRSIEDSTRTFSSMSAMVEDFLCHGERSSSWLVRYVTPEMATQFMHLMPTLRELYPVETKEAEHSESSYSVFLTFHEFFQRLSRSRPMIVVLDDIQWMSDESLQLLQYLANRICNLPVLLIAVVRSSTENKTLDVITEELSTKRLIQIIDLENLSPDEVSDLIDRKLNCPPNEHFKEWLTSLTKGNPLFIEEIIKALFRQNIIHADGEDEHWIVEDDYRDFIVSQTVESVVNYRLSQLDAEEISTLECAAIIGDKFNIHTLQDLLPSHLSASSMRPINILESIGMLEQSMGNYLFSHPLIRQVLYRGMDRNTRRKLHRKLAAILEKQNGDDAETALHLTRDLQPEEETPELALHLFRLAMNLKEKALDYKRSWEYMSLALRIAERAQIGETELLRIRAEFNYLSWTKGGKTLSLPDTEILLADLMEHQLVREVAFTCHILFHSALMNLDMEKAEEYLEKGIELMKERDSIYWNFRAEKPLLMRRKGLLEQSLEACRALIQDIPQHVAPEALYRVYTNMGLVCFLKGEVTIAGNHLRRAREVVQDYSLLLRSPDSRLNLGLVLVTMGKLDSALVEFNESMKEAELLNREPIIGISLLYIGYCFYSKGDLTGSLRYLDMALEKALEISNPKLDLSARVILANIHLKNGEIGKATDIANQIESSDKQEQLECSFLILKARIALAEDRSEEAKDFINRAITLAEDAGLGTKHGIAVGIRGLIQLHEGNADDALQSLAESKLLLLEKGEVPMMSDILVNFGLKFGGNQGEEILLQGLGLLRQMRATSAIQTLKEDIAEGSSDFNDVLKVIEGCSDEPNSSQIEIQTFGGLSIRRPGELMDVAQRNWGYSKSRELLALLLLMADREAITRDIMISHLWPDTPEKKALASLRVALTHLRKAVGTDAVIQDGLHLHLNGELIQADLWEFNSLLGEWSTFLRDGKDHAAEDRALRAIDLYRGDFLPEFYSTPLEDQQFKLKNSMRELLLWMARRSMDRVEYRDAVRYARRLLSMDPCNEKACRIIMEGLAATDDRAAAIRQYRRLRNSLTSEFNTSPDKKTTDLYETLISKG